MAALCGIFSPRNPAMAEASTLERLVAALLHRATGHAMMESPSRSASPGSGVALAAVAGAFFEDESCLAAAEGNVRSVGATGGVSGRAGLAAVMHSYQQEPQRFPVAAAGAWACAWFDRQRQQLWLAQDPLANKPLYYSHDATSGLVVFAS